MPLPRSFCWTRFGIEAGQSVEQILARKEQERIANAGLFFWGIGNAIGPSVLELLKQTDAPEALFSPIRSLPRSEDAMPASVVAWTEAQTVSGEEYQLPEGSLITSRFDPLRSRARHYALVCHSETPLAVGVLSEQIRFGELRNLLTSRPVGASQVTAVVHMDLAVHSGKSLSYNVAFRTKLSPPYFLILRKPTPLVHPDDRRGWGDIVGRAWNLKREVPAPRQ